MAAPTTAACVKKALANPEPSTHGPSGDDNEVTDPSTLTLTEVAAAIREHKLSSVEVTRSLLARIEGWQPVLNAFVRVEAEEALATATAADAAGGATRGPLHGVPLAHKDMYYISG